MRTRAVLVVLTVALAASSAAGGCQILTGLTDLAVTGGAGGGQDGGTDAGTGGSGDGGPTCKVDCGAYACNASGTACNTTCTTSSQCAQDHFCAPGPMMSANQCIACGMSPQPPMCPADAGCTSCTGNTCTTTCGPTEDCTADAGLLRMLDATKRPAVLQCGAQCGSITVQCQGMFPCEVDCAAQGCTMMTLICSDGPCTLKCDGMGCSMASMTCGHNECTTTYFHPKNMPPPVTQNNCTESCKCTETNEDPNGGQP